MRDSYEDIGINFILFLPFIVILLLLSPFIYFLIMTIWIVDDRLEYSKRKCFICRKKDKYLERADVYDPEHLDFENAYRSFWYHNICTKKVGEDNYSDYIVKTLESIKRGYLVDGWPEEALKIGFLSENERREYRRPFKRST